MKTMTTLSPEETARYIELRDRAGGNPGLNEAEEQDRVELERRWDEADAARFAQINRRIQTETEAIRRGTRALKELVRQKQELATRAQKFLDELHTEQARIDAEIAGLLASAEGAEQVISL